MKQTFGPAPVRPFPYVEGQTRRIKAEPTKLSGVALRVMAASGNFSTRRAAAPAFSGLWLGALGIALVAAAIAIAGHDARTGDRAEASRAAALPPQVQAADEAPPASLAPAAAPSRSVQREAHAEMHAAAAKADTALEGLDAQDHFEVARFHRLGAAATQTLAPAAGPAAR